MSVQDKELALRIAQTTTALVHEVTSWLNNASACPLCGAIFREVPGEAGETLVHHERCPIHSLRDTIGQISVDLYELDGTIPDLTVRA